MIDISGHQVQTEAEIRLFRGALAAVESELRTMPSWEVGSAFHADRLRVRSNLLEALLRRRHDYVPAPCDWEVDHTPPPFEPSLADRSWAAAEDLADWAEYRRYAEDVERQALLAGMEPQHIAGCVHELGDQV